MHSEVTTMSDKADATVLLGGSTTETTGLTGYYDVKCLDSAGNVKWEETIKNLVTTVGKNDILDKYFAGTSYTAAWYMGLVDGASTPTYAVGDTLASHAGWTELAAGTAYSGSRPTVSWSAASAGSKASTATTFTISATNTVAGALLATVASGTSGTLYSAGSFTGGNRSVSSGDTLLVTYTAVAA